jgi:broad specificity phosphatase PhoE
LRRLILVRHASTRALRRACFAPEDALDARGRAQAEALRGTLPSRADALAAPCLAAFQTASLAGYAPVRIEQALADGDYGRWAGRTLQDVQREEHEAVAEWLADPDAAPHGGESVRALLRRVAAWIEAQADLDGTVVAVAPASVVRAAVVAALDAPAAAFWRLDVAPASVTELHLEPGRVTVARVNERGAARGRPDAEQPPHGRAAAGADAPR